MAYKQPRVPEYRGNDGAYLKALILFLKDFTMEAWTANNRRAGEIRRLGESIEELKAQMNGGEEG